MCRFYGSDHIKACLAKWPGPVHYSTRTESIDVTTMHGSGGSGDTTLVALLSGICVCQQRMSNIFLEAKLSVCVNEN